MEELFRSPLFQGVSAADAASMLQCLGAQRQHYARGERILRMGETTESLGLVLAGRVRVESVDMWGGRTLLGDAGPGEVFAEAYACVPGETLMVDAVAAEDAEILFLNAARVLRLCPNACAFHGRMVQNLLTVLARKNLALARRSLHSAPRTIRGKLLSYLSFQALRQRSRSFAIPFDRQELADYLGVDRSALSSELGKMRREGLIDFHKNRFELKDTGDPLPDGGANARE